MALANGARVDHIERPAIRIAYDGLAPRLTRQKRVIELLDALEALVVQARETDNLGRNAPLRVDALFLLLEVDALDPTFLELGGERRVGLALEVDEPARGVGELREGDIAVESEISRDEIGHRSRIIDVLRVCEDRRPQLADRKLATPAIEDRASPWRGDDGVPRLAFRARIEGGRFDGLQPH